MWSESEFKGKAAKYFARAQDAADDEGQLIWSLLGLEFLLRAPIARYNPILLADASSGNGSSLLYAAGLEAGGSREPTSIQARIVIERLFLVASFTEDDKNDANFLLALRNREIHSSESVALNASGTTWLPKFYRIVSKLTSSMGETPEDYFNDEFIKHASGLVDEQDKRLTAKIGERIKHCVDFYSRLSKEEVTARRARVYVPSLEEDLFFVPVDKYDHLKHARCPACKNFAELQIEVTRYGREELRDNGKIARRIFLTTKAFKCAVCGLELSGIREVVAAGLPQEFIEEEVESLEDRVSRYDDDYDPDYEDDDQ